MIEFKCACRVAFVAVGVAALSSSNCFAFWGFSQAEPDVSIAYNRAECLASGGIKITVRNSSAEPLSAIVGNVMIYRPESSRLGAEFGFGSDRVIDPNSAMAFCIGVPRESVLLVISAKEPEAAYWELSSKYGFDGNAIDPDVYLKDSIIKFEIKSFKYGLPY
ncbi:hypothetical protein N5C66_10890 [Rhizobium pusense]|nr:hypothetical protein [Agrobacterium pusense]MDH1112238.1 hypothetical protein [Agrobacterium pusense]